MGVNIATKGHMNTGEIAVYLAGRFDSRQKLRNVRTLLAEKGFSVTSSWIDTPDDVEDENLSQECRQAAATRDLADIKSSDAFVLFSSSGMAGALVEFGFSLALGLPTVIIGDKRLAGIFGSLTPEYESIAPATDFLREEIQRPVLTSVGHVC